MLNLQTKSIFHFPPGLPAVAQLMRATVPSGGATIAPANAGRSRSRAAVRSAVYKGHSAAGNA